MKTKLKPWQITLLAIFSIMFAALASIFSLKATTVDEEETPEELVDNWSLDVVFYDSTVNNGKTPLTEINWDASDGSYEVGEARTITVQINYKNTSVVTTYAPGELKLTIPNLIYNTEYGDMQWTASVTLGANDSTHTGNAWSFSTGTAPSKSHKTFTFINANTIEEKTNFEGTLQIIYVITPKGEEYPEKYQETCTHSFETSLQANLMDISNTILSSSNEAEFNYVRVYTHPWIHPEYTIKKTASKISSYDLLPNADDYIWVKYEVRIDGKLWDEYPSTGAEFYLSDTFPAECVVLNHNLEPEPLENNTSISDSCCSLSAYVHYKHYYVGYPKTIYNENENNLEITNIVDMYVKYGDTDDYEFHKQASVTINLANFEFAYSGNLYSISKQSASHGLFCSQFFLEPDFTHGCWYCSSRASHVVEPHASTLSTWHQSVTARYTGNPMTVRFGDDLLYITDSDGDYRRLEDNEYWIESIRLTNLYNGNGIKINYDKYNTNLFVKYAGDSEYTYYMNLADQKGGNVISFNSERKIIAFYIQIDDMNESLSTSIPNLNEYSIGIHIKPINNIAISGKVYNFNYLNIYFKDTSGNLILQNEPTIDSYSTLITKENIATYDLNTYSHYLQRSSAYITYSEYESMNIDYSLVPYKKMNEFTQNNENEIFTNTNKIGFYMLGDDQFYSVHDDNTYLQKVFLNNMDDSYFITKYAIYDLLPAGMELTTTKEELMESISYLLPSYSSSSTDYYNYCYYKNGDKAFTSEEAFIECVKNHSDIIVTENWKGTGRTKIDWIIDFSDNPIFFFRGSSGGYYYYYYPCFYISYDAQVTYNSYLEYGNIYENICYAELEQNYEHKAGSSAIKDNGVKDIEALDINENGIINEDISYTSVQKEIIATVSTHQDVTTYVKTNQSNYSTGIVDTSCNSEYEYKLRVRTGSANVTNLIVYTNLEEAQKGKDRWKGEFLGLDTSYAQNKGYNVKPYYSENPQAGNLYNEDGSLNSDWKEYIPDTSEIVANGLSITFDENFKTYNYSDYLYIYYYYNDALYCSSLYYGTSLAGKTIEIPSTDVYFYWYTSSSGNSAYGFKVNNIEPKVVSTILGSKTSSLPSITPTELTDTNYPETNHNPYNNSEKILWHYTYTKSLILQEYVEHIPKDSIKSLAFEYLDTDGNPAVLPANSLTYVLIKMKSPADEDETRLARMDCWTQWNAIDEFNQPVDFITGINSNVVKIALPNSVKTDDMPSISLKFTKEIIGSETDFENMNLNNTDNHIFAIRLTSLTANDDGTYNQVTGLLSSNTGLIISQIPIGTYLLEELGNNYFNFVDFTNNNNPEIVIEGVTFEKTDQGYIITVSEDLTEDIEFNIKVTNEIESERFFEDKNNEENLFLINKTGIDHNTPED